MYLIALLLVIAGLALGGSETKPGASGHALAAQAIEITCTRDATTVSVPTGTARPDGVVVRFAHGPGEWLMTWEGAPGHSTSAGSAHTAELVWPVPPGRARVLCHPADLPPDADPYRQSRWWVRVRVEDPHGFHVSPSAACRTWMGAPWHGGSVPAEQEQSAAWKALDMLGIPRRSSDLLVRSGYPEARPRQWALWRDGEPVAGVVMALRPDGRAEPSNVGACADEVERQSSTS